MAAALRRPARPGKSSRLTYILARYWQPIEADFARVYPGTDPGALWRSREWRKLLNLIDHLPQNTWYQAAVSEDVEHQEMLLDAREAAEKNGTPHDGPPSPSLAIWSPEVDKLAELIDVSRAVYAATVKAGGGKPKDPQPVPRPKSAMESAKLRRRKREHDALVSRLVPSRAQPDDE